MKNVMRLILLVLFALPPLIEASETPETLLIRQVLSNDISGYRRGDTELALGGYGEHFVSYLGHQNGDPRSWTVRHESRDALAEQMTADVQTSRYEVTRTVPHILVRSTHAVATSIDSGQVVNRQNGATTPVYTQRLWTFHKTENDWHATAMVEGLGDTLLPATPSSDGSIIEVLQSEEQAWEEGSTSGIISLFDEYFTGYDGRSGFDPTTWRIVFSGAEEMEKWLDKRLPYVQYDLDRKVLHSAIGANGSEALAVTRETVAITHAKGPTKHSKERYVLWTLSRRSGSWKITNMLYDLGIAD